MSDPAHVAQRVGHADIDRCMSLCTRVGWPVQPSKWTMIRGWSTLPGDRARYHATALYAFG